MQECWCKQCDRIMDGVTVKLANGYRYKCADCQQIDKAFRYYFASVERVKRGLRRGPALRIQRIATCEYCSRAYGARRRKQRFCSKHCSAMSWMETYGRRQWKTAA